MLLLLLLQLLLIAHVLLLLIRIFTPLLLVNSPDMWKRIVLCMCEMSLCGKQTWTVPLLLIRCIFSPVLSRSVKLYHSANKKLFWFKLTVVVQRKFNSCNRIHLFAVKVVGSKPLRQIKSHRLNTPTSILRPLLQTKIVSVCHVVFHC